MINGNPTPEYHMLLTLGFGLCALFFIYLIRKAARSVTLWVDRIVRRRRVVRMLPRHLDDSPRAVDNVAQIVTFRQYQAHESVDNV
jgi:hypothetical protein